MSQWYLSRGGQQSGPHSLEQLQALAQTGQLGPDAHVSGPGLNGWTPAGQVPGLTSPSPAVPSPQLQGGAYAAPAPGYPPTPGFGAASGVGGFGAAMPAPMLAPPGAGAVAPPGAQALPPAPKSDWVKERLRGLGAIGIALLVLVLNGVTIFAFDSFYPQSLVVGLGALGYGGWVIIFGDEYDDYTLKLVRWKQVGMWACAAVGAIIGLILSIWLAA
ncbi:MAG: DUF4339 domain-containing protein [Myxococcales bacterium]|nr:DUF4339 domain-containing protein [Myxococcales bacterium]